MDDSSEPPNTHGASSAGPTTHVFRLELPSLFRSVTSRSQPKFVFRPESAIARSTATQTGLTLQQANELWKTKRGFIVHRLPALLVGLTPPFESSADEVFTKFAECLKGEGLFLEQQATEVKYWELPEPIGLVGTLTRKQLKDILRKATARWALISSR